MPIQLLSTTFREALGIIDKQWPNACDYFFVMHPFEKLPTDFESLVLLLPKKYRRALTLTNINAEIGNLKSASVESLVKMAILDYLNNEDFLPSLILLQMRTDRIVFDQACDLCKSLDSSSRAVGVMLMRDKLGVAFKSEATKVINKLVQTEVDPSVLTELAYTMAALNVQRRSKILAKLSTHSVATVRQAVASALAGEPDKQSIKALIHLSKDCDSEVRNFATWGLADENTPNTAEIRNALFARLEDEFEEVRIEAMIGLACRKDRRVIPPLIKALNSPKISYGMIEAARQLEDPSLTPLLTKILEKLKNDNNRKLVVNALQSPMNAPEVR
ncbi:MAG: HEAT repeat domain-containing protein [Cyanobacteria bacterium SZAS LIN-2]|nr:HEAT repeat domain-containing protein [Cyanobacteria bacterium SZAS LIN-2]